ncbi:hypothetical protein VTJ04DRAFT_4798 [Mycothermus thermophilus]|uniref:uncharacterized protein n=1 Tax=Humicola insolens TaxID=85995 RepID=UPI003742A02C
MELPATEDTRRRRGRSVLGLGVMGFYFLNTSFSHDTTGYHTEDGTGNQPSYHSLQHPFETRSEYQATDEQQYHHHHRDRTSGVGGFAEAGKQRTQCCLFLLTPNLVEDERILLGTHGMVDGTITLGNGSVWLAIERVYSFVERQLT